MKKELLLTVLSIVVVIVIFLVYWYFSVSHEKMWEVDEQNKIEVKHQEITSEKIKTGDFDECQNIDDDMYRDVCINNIALNLSKTNKDVSICSKMSGKLVSIWECERAVVWPLSMEQSDISICDLASDQAVVEQCRSSYTMYFAQKSWNESDCGNDARCVNTLLLKKYTQVSKELCEKVQGVDAKNDCLSVLEVSDLFQQNIMYPDMIASVCSNLKTQYFESACLEFKKFISQ